MYSACVPLQLSLIQKNEFSFLKAAEQSTSSSISKLHEHISNFVQTEHTTLWQTYNYLM